MSEEPDSVADSEIGLGNLPGRLTPLLGRAQALDELRTIIWRTRLLTLAGPGGAGKTRLAGALAESVRDDFTQGAWWVDLSSTVDSGLVGIGVASTVVPGERVSDPVDAIVRRLSPGALLVLDNCEQVAEGCAELLLGLLARAPAVRVVATSRQPLGLPGEQVWRVAGLAIESTPPAGEPLMPNENAAVALFLQRAREASAAFTATDPERETVARICRWLDGMPLAIELAAARVSLLGVEQIAERLEDDPALLTSARRAVPERHRTLEALLDWSHRLLDPTQARLLTRLGIFLGSFSLEAAERVCADPLLPAGGVLDALGGLVDHSLVQVVAGSAPRYRLLSTVRQYTVGRLDRSGELAPVAARHAEYFRELAGASAGAGGALDGLELDHDNLGEALRWLFAHDPGAGARLASDLWPFWYQRGLYEEAGGWYEIALSHRLQRGARIDALLKAGETTFLRCDYGRAAAHVRRALELCDAEDGRFRATALQQLGSIAREQGRYAESIELHEQSLARWSELGDGEGVTASHDYLGFCAWLSGDLARAEREGEAALEALRPRGLSRELAAALVNLGATALYSGDHDRAGEVLGEALTVSRRLGFQEGIAWAAHELAVLARRRRRTDDATDALLRDALLIHHQLGDRWRLASVLDEIAISSLSRTDPPRAVRVLAAATSLREQLGVIVPAVEAEEHAAGLARLRRQLPVSTYESAWVEGRALGLDRVVDLAAVWSTGLAGPGPIDPALAAAPALTPREIAVLELICLGHTNREIASALFISPSTAGVHVSNILRKLRAKRRVDAAGRAHELGLLSST